MSGTLTKWYRTGREGPVYEAIRVDEENVKFVSEWCGGTLIRETNHILDEEQLGINVPTHEGAFGMTRVGLGDYVVKAPNDRFVVRKARVFETLFHPVEGDPVQPETSKEVELESGFHQIRRGEI